MGVSKNNGTPKSSISIGFSIINHPFWVPLLLETPMCLSNSFLCMFFCSCVLLALCKKGYWSRPSHIYSAFFASLEAVKMQPFVCSQDNHLPHLRLLGCSHLFWILFNCKISIKSIFGFGFSFWSDSKTLWRAYELEWISLLKPFFFWGGGNSCVFFSALAPRPQVWSQC